MDTCGSIAYNYSLTVEQLETLNPALDCEVVGPYPGYEICVTGGKVVTQAPSIETTVLMLIPAFATILQNQPQDRCFATRAMCLHRLLMRHVKELHLQCSYLLDLEKGRDTQWQAEGF